jgi:EmrB/QacA subfamily drug resistance transporter
MTRAVDVPRDQSADAARPVRTGRHANTTLVVLFMSLAGLAFSVLQSLVAPALPLLARDLHTNTGGVSWVLSAYLLSASVLTPILGRLGDMVGKRRTLLAVLTVLAAGTVLAAIAPNLGVLIIARALQGAGGAILPLSIGIVRDELPRERISVTVGLLSALFGIGGGLGIVLAGPIVDHLGWRWLFWAPLIMIAAALIGALVGVPESPVRTPGRLDLPGATLLSAALVALLLAITQGGDWGWGSPATVALFAVGVVALAAFMVVELRVREPLVNMRLMAGRGVWTTNLTGLIFGFAMYGTFLLIPMLLELPAATGYGFGKTITDAGLLLLPMAGAMLVFGILSGLLDRRFGPKVPLTLGALILAIGFGTAAIAHGSTGQLLLALIASGAGVGLAFAAMSNAIIESVPATHTGEATSVNSIMRTIGGSVGTAVVAAVLASHSTAQGLPAEKAFTIGFWTCAAVGALAVLAALALPGRRRGAAATD